MKKPKKSTMGDTKNMRPGVLKRRPHSPSEEPSPIKPFNLHKKGE